MIVFRLWDSEWGLVNFSVGVLMGHIHVTVSASDNFIFIFADKG